MMKIIPPKGQLKTVSFSYDPFGLPRAFSWAEGEGGGEGEGDRDPVNTFASPGKPASL